MTMQRPALDLAHGHSRATVSTRRNDVQGLRTVSALLVGIFHVWLTGISGGVDVFFVVAGYFMARSALNRLEVDGRLDIRAIWQQLAVRIFPNLIVCLIGVIVLVFVLLDRSIQAGALRHVIASALYVENYYLVWLAHDPSTRHGAQQVTEHLWALGLIGQGYLLLPLLLAVVVRTARGDATRVRHIALATTLAITAASFVYGLYATASNPDAAYYALLPRLWQFTSGAALAMMPNEGRCLPRAVAAAGSWIGLALIASCGLLIGGWATFPGLAALWPASAGLLILYFGRQDDPANAGWLLSRRPLTSLGAYSYGFYIWHWPVAFVALQASEWQSLSLTVGTAVIVTSFALAAITDAGTRRLMATKWFAASATRRAIALVSMLLLIAAFAAIVLVVRNGP